MFLGILTRFSVKLIEARKRHDKMQSLKILVNQIMKNSVKLKGAQNPLKFSENQTMKKIRQIEGF